MSAELLTQSVSGRTPVTPWSKSGHATTICRRFSPPRSIGSTSWSTNSEPNGPVTGRPNGERTEEHCKTGSISWPAWRPIGPVHAEREQLAAERRTGRKGSQKNKLVNYT